MKHIWAELRGRNKAEVSIETRTIVAGFDNESGGIYQRAIVDVVRPNAGAEYGYLSHLPDLDRGVAGTVYTHYIVCTLGEFFYAETHRDGSRLSPTLIPMTAKNWRRAIHDVLLTIPELADHEARNRAYHRAQKLAIRAAALQMEYGLDG